MSSFSLDKSSVTSMTRKVFFVCHWNPNGNGRWRALCSCRLAFLFQNGSLPRVRWSQGSLVPWIGNARLAQMEGSLWGNGNKMEINGTKWGERNTPLTRSDFDICIRLQKNQQKAKISRKGPVERAEDGKNCFWNKFNHLLAKVPTNLLIFNSIWKSVSGWIKVEPNRSGPFGPSFVLFI